MIASSEVPAFYSLSCKQTAKDYSPEEHRCVPYCISSLHEVEVDIEGVAKAPQVHGPAAPDEPTVAACDHVCRLVMRLT